MKVHVDDGWSEAVDTRLGRCGVQTKRNRHKKEYQGGQPLHEILHQVRESAADFRRG
jgi:hypothetical protein